MIEHGFTRTVCACEHCTNCCKRQPGSLIPGDMERIAEYLGMTLEDAKQFFWASPGALAKAGDKTFRIGTITPRYLKRLGKCIFLDDKDRCTIHEVAPFGCAYFDTHMSWHQGQARSCWMAGEQHDSADYQALRNTLPYATHHKPNRY